jgi:superfamily II DNA/RNA helicase
MVATNVVAWRLDIDDFSHVFNNDLLDDPELYERRVVGSAITEVRKKKAGSIKTQEQINTVKVR